jgi:hypothetical protein
MLLIFNNHHLPTQLLDLFATGIKIERQVKYDEYVFQKSRKYLDKGVVYSLEE